MATVFIIHGSYGDPEENWFPWLTKELQDRGCQVFVPEFPTPKNQSLQTWRSVFSGYEGYVDDETIFIGHSLGPAFILDLLEKVEESVHLTVFVSGFLGLLDNEKFDSINKTFVDREFDWERIKKNCKKFIVIHADNDLYVPVEKSLELAEKLGVEPIIIPGGGHFNADAGFKEFPALLSLIENEL